MPDQVLTPGKQMTGMPNIKNNVLKIAIFAGVITFLVYLPALYCGFVNYEDPEYVINNPVIRSFDKDFWHWAFGSVPLNFWVPLLWMSFALDYHFWGLDPFGYHLTNILLHAINTGFVAFIADKIYTSSPLKERTGPESGYLYPAMILLAALLFGLHPARVESVAWITERKDVLNGLFTLASLFCYLRYVEKQAVSGARTQVVSNYTASVFLFLLSLTAKPGSVFIPFGLLVMDWWPLERFRKTSTAKLFAEKAPYLILAIPIIAASVIGRSSQGGYNSLDVYPFTVRLVAAGNSILEYFSLMLFPVGILPYSHLPRPVPTLYIYKAAIAYLSFFFIVWMGRKKYPWLVALVLFFVVTLFPALHFFADGYQVILAPRYTYLASLLPVVIIAAMVFYGYEKLLLWQRSLGRVFAGFIMLMLVFYSITTYRLIGDWKDSGTMWNKVISRQPFEKAYFYRGEYLAEKGKYLEAINDYTTCITLSAGITGPKMYNVYAFRGVALMEAGYYQDALDDLTTAISLNPVPQYYYFRGAVLKKMGRLIDADEDFRSAGRSDGRLYWVE
jgi:hypothetical protein